MPQRTFAVTVLAGFLLGAIHTVLGAAPEVSLSGSWTLLNEREGEKKEYHIVLHHEGEKLSGTWVSPRTGMQTIESGTFKDGKLALKVTRRREETTRVYTVEAEQNETGKFEGRLTIDGHAAGPVVMTRSTSPAAGKWSVISKAPDGGREYPSTIEIAEEGGKLTGKSASQLGEFSLQALKMEGEKLSFELTLPIGGNDVTFVVTTEFEGGNKLLGRWKVRDAEFTGEWTATREKAPAEVAAPPKPAEPAVAKPAEPAKPGVAQGLAGKWYALTETSSEGKTSFQLDLRIEGDQVAGKFTSKNSKADIHHGKAHGSKLELSFTITTGEGAEVEVKMEAELDAQQILRGKWSAGSETGEFTGRKSIKL